jgi:hypothetical protein
MSEVTNVLLAFSILENDDARIAEVNAWLEANCGHALTTVWGNRDCYGGGKAMEAPLYAAAINDLPLTEFLAHLRTVQWKEPDCVQLILHGQHDDRWRIIAA